MNTSHEESGVIAGLCFLICGFLIVVVLLTSCVEHHLTAPQLDTALDKLASLPPPVKCRKLDLPPVPDKATLAISGDKVTADAGGETLFRGYVTCRSWPAAP